MKVTMIRIRMIIDTSYYIKSFSKRSFKSLYVPGMHDMKTRPWAMSKAKPQAREIKKL